MIAGAKPYPTYKESSTPLLGHVPEHWKLLPIKRVARLKAGEGITSLQITEAGDYPVYGGNGVRGYTSNFTHEGKFVLIGRQGALCGNINYAQGRFWASEHAVVVEPLQSHDPIWLGEMLRTINLNQYSLAAAQPGLSIERIENIPIAVPSPPEQAAITRTIHYIERRVRTYIAAKKKLIALLNEQKQAIIQRAVMCGLDRNVRLKPSGVEWLGDVPEHWKVTRLRNVLAQRIRNGLYKTPEYYQDDGTPMIQMGEAFALPTIAQAARDRVRLSQDERAKWMLAPGDLLFARRSLVLEGSGKCSIVGELPEQHVFESSLIRVRLDGRQVLPSFLFFFFKSSFSRSEVLAVAKQVTISGIDGQQLKSLTVLAPPIHEQVKIVSEVKRQSEPIDRTIRRVERQILSIREYRNRLVADLITGKLDVREAAAQLPEEPAEAEPLEEAEPATEGEDLELDSATEEAEA